MTLRTAVFWTLLGVMTVTQGTLAVAMRVQGVMRPSMGSLWGPWPRWVRLGSVSGSCWVGALPLVSTLDRVVGTVAVLLWTPHPPAGHASTATPYPMGKGSVLQLPGCACAVPQVPLLGMAPGEVGVLR